jgi:hypothetical protein
MIDKITQSILQSMYQRDFSEIMAQIQKTNRHNDGLY